VLTGSKYNLSADMWSLACMTFEMLTGELLFNPRKDQSDNFGKNDDHLAQMMELLGRFPRKFTVRGAKSRKYFSKEGNLARIPKLQNWSLKDVMIAKYRFTEPEAEFF
jgi:serine/threonine-protein kinase SRPK3